MQVNLESPNQPEIKLLIEALDSYQASLYPPEARYALNLNELAKSSLLFAVARCEGGAAIACGAALLSDAVAEIKRMYVKPEYRKQGAASKVLVFLQAEASKRGCKLLQLETGVSQPEALAFYRKHGFKVCDSFAPYPEHPMSVFMGKDIF